VKTSNPTPSKFTLHTKYTMLSDHLKGKDVPEDPAIGYYKEKGSAGSRQGLVDGYCNVFSGSTKNGEFLDELGD
jgi:hypothetical protein